MHLVGNCSLLNPGTVPRALGFKECPKSRVFHDLPGALFKTKIIRRRKENGGRSNTRQRKQKRRKHSKGLEPLGVQRVRLDLLLF